MLLSLNKQAIRNTQMNQTASMPLADGSIVQSKFLKLNPQLPAGIFKLY
ncbi:hypothetical protein NC99_38320 [Sunxiuqinia dokdonensis]|uniref:Uncharacterized protein n=1 Tax=Sunxiuqinia dokdonensis TaxID=1409788 RepID=A0A0L8V4I9_9BACT|nr:hypothetical protein NC99_38320 [Sunxiuqinia dokdonensis]